MSTLDSQLLTLSSMLTRDLVDPLTKEHASSRQASPWVGKGFVIVLALIGLAIAWRPPATFLEIATETFTGLAVLFPTVIAALYWRRATAGGAIASILVGEGLVVAYHLHLLPTLGTLPVIPVVLAASLTLIGVSLLTQPQAQAAEERHKEKKGTWKWVVAFLLLFLLGNDYWVWGDGRLGPLGFPWWVWYFLSLCLLMSLTFWLFARDRCDWQEAHRSDS
jgi:SSS family solute:Na+ symporter